MVNQTTLRPKFGTHVTGPGFWSGKPGPESLVARLENGESSQDFRPPPDRQVLPAVRNRSPACRPATPDHPTRRSAASRSIPILLKEIIRQLPLEKGPVHRLLDWSKKVGLPPEVKLKFEALITEQIVGTSEPDLDAYAELLFRELGAAFGALPHAQRPVLCIDELPWFCDNVMKAAPSASREAAASQLNNLLAVLRAWRGRGHRHRNGGLRLPVDGLAATGTQDTIPNI